MKITELRLSKLFSANATAASTTNIQYASDMAKVGEDRVSRISGHLGAAKKTPAEKSAERFTRTRPPITTHVLDIARGSPAAGIEVLLETWDNNQSRPLFGQMDSSRNWRLQGSSTTDKDGRSGQLMKMVDILSPGIYRISFHTGTYNAAGFFPYVSIYCFLSPGFAKVGAFSCPAVASSISIQHLPWELAANCCVSMKLKIEESSLSFLLQLANLIMRRM